jgi:hypothetical protein
VVGDVGQRAAISAVLLLELFNHWLHIRENLRVFGHIGFHLVQIAAVKLNQRTAFESI